MAQEIAFTVFTKPWPKMEIAALARFVRELGFDGVELPVRPGFQVTPEKAERGLAEAARVFREEGVRIGSVAGSADERTVAACGEAGVPLVRVCLGVSREEGYWATVERLRREFDALAPVLEKYGVRLGIQNHAGWMFGSAVSVMHLIERHDPSLFGIVLDVAHCGLDGEPEVLAVDVAWRRLALVNLKSAFHVRANGPEAEEADWKIYWTTGPHGLVSWKEVARELVRRGYHGDVCLTAEYSDPYAAPHLTGDAVTPLIRRDLTYARRLFEEVSAQ